MRTIRYSVLIAVAALGGAMASAQNNATEIMGRSQAQLIELLRSPSASTFEKAKACQRLAVIGNKDAVPALAALLADEKLNDYARFGLEPIADPSVDAVLRDAATKLGGRQLIGVIDSIGQRQDAAAVALLAKLLTAEDNAVASAAAGALGRIATVKAVEALLPEANNAENAAVSDALLACVERQGRGGEEICAFIMSGTGEFPKRIKISALSNLFRLQGALAMPMLLEQLRSNDKDFFNVGLAAAREIPGAEVTTALAAELKSLPPDRRALLLLAIGAREDAAPDALFLNAMKSSSSAVREAAIHVLIRRGDAAAVEALLDAALAGTETSKSATDGLKTMPGPTVDAVVLARLSVADARSRAVLIELIGARQIVRATPLVREAIGESDEAIRLAALAALGQLTDVAGLDVLIDQALADGKASEVAMAQAALRTASQRMRERDACAAKLAKRLEGATTAQQAFLLEVLGKVGGPKALEAVVARLKSGDAAAKDTATRVLGEWPNAEAAPVLLEIAKNDPEAKYQTRALRGYLRIARQLEIPWWMASNAEETKITMFREAMKIAKRDQEKRLALEVLTRVPSATALKLAAEYVDDPGVKDAAADVAIKIAEKVSEPNEVAKAMRKIIAADVAPALKDRAKQRMPSGTTRKGAARDGFRPIFDGKSLAGWDGDPKLWCIDEGAITGQTTADSPTKGNTFLIWRSGQPADFELKFDFKLTNHNSGVQYRSREVPGQQNRWVVGGYQADIDEANRYTGILYEERGRAIIGPRGQRVVIGDDHKPRPIAEIGDSAELAAKIRKGDWNQYHVVARGNHLQHFINGQLMADVTDNDSKLRSSRGILALQLHAGPPMKVQFRNIRLKNLSP